jgi:hypothetical protein
MGDLGKKVVSAMLSAFFLPLLTLIKGIAGGDPFFGTMLYMWIFFIFSVPFVLAFGTPTSVLIDRLATKMGWRMLLYLVFGALLGALLSFILGEPAHSSFFGNLFFYGTAGCSLFFGLVDNFLIHRKSKASFSGRCNQNDQKSVISSEPVRKHHERENKE